MGQVCPFLLPPSPSVLRQVLVGTSLLVSFTGLVKSVMIIISIFTIIFSQYSGIISHSLNLVQAIVTFLQSVQSDPLAGKPATAEAKRNPPMHFHRESTRLLGATDRGRMKDAPPEKWTRQRLCAAPWEASCSIPARPLPTLNTLRSPPLLWLLQDTELSLAAHLPRLALGYLPAPAL